MSDRGMKKWLPYKSLTEQGGYLSEIIARKSVEEQPIPMEDEAEKIDSFLRNYADGEIELRYFTSGHVHHYKGVPIRVDFRKKRIAVASFEVPFAAIVEIVGNENFDISQ